jgi:hypothetical protein
MNDIYETQFSDELYHYGRKGMKWYQNIFTAGKNLRRKHKQKKALEKARQAKVAKKQEEEAKQKAVKTGDVKEILKYKDKMTTEELRDASARVRAMQDLASLTPKQEKQVSKGKSFVGKMMKDVFIPAASESAKGLIKDYLNKKGKEMLGLKEPEDSLKDIRKKVESLELRKRETEANDYFTKRANRNPEDEARSEAIKRELEELKLQQARLALETLRNKK